MTLTSETPLDTLDTAPTVQGRHCVLEAVAAVAQATYKLPASATVAALLHEGRRLHNPTRETVIEFLDRVDVPSRTPDRRSLISGLRTALSAMSERGSTLPTGAQWHAARSIMTALPGHHGQSALGALPQPALPTGRPLRVAFDVDEVLYQWVRAYSHHAAPTLGTPADWLDAITTYSFWAERGLTREQFHDLHVAGIRAGTMFTMPGMAIPGGAAAVRRVRAAGHTPIAVTARVFPDMADEVERQTREWFAAEGFQFDELHITDDKTTVDYDVLVDDSPHNLATVVEDGRRVVTFSRPWNHSLTGRAGQFRGFGWPDTLRHLPA